MQVKLSERLLEVANFSKSYFSDADALSTCVVIMDCSVCIYPSTSQVIYILLTL